MHMYTYSAPLCTCIIIFDGWSSAYEVVSNYDKGCGEWCVIAIYGGSIG